MLGFIIGTMVCSELAAAVINGTLVKQGEFDAVGTVGNNSDCTGTLIQGNLVLTAAHCFEGCPSFGCRSNFTLYNISLKNESSLGQDYSFYGNVVLNPNYKNDTEGADLALIKLDKNVSQILPVVKPIIISKPYLMKTYTNVTFLGFGNISKNCEILNLRNKYKSNASVILVMAQCREVCPFPLSDPGVTGICPGDSGGPALDNATKIVGITRGPIRSDNLSNDYEEMTWKLTRISNKSYNWIYNVTKNAALIQSSQHVSSESNQY